MALPRGLLAGLREPRPSLMRAARARRCPRPFRSCPRHAASAPPGVLARRGGELVRGVHPLAAMNRSISCATLFCFGIAATVCVVGCSGGGTDVLDGTGGPGTPGIGGAAGSGGANAGGSASGGSASGGSASGGSASGGTASGGSSTGGSASGGASTGGSGGSEQSCTTSECLRPYVCAVACGAEEVDYGCCGCPEGTIDTITCPDPSIQTGIWGTVTWLEGNHQPGSSPNAGAGTPISREVRFFEPLTMADAVEATDRTDAHSVYDSVSGTMVQAVTSDAAGFYEAELPAGTYSVLVEDEGDWFCNSVSGDGILCAVEVSADTATQYEIKIDYAASF